MFREAGAEFLGTMILVCAVVGSGVMSRGLTIDPAIVILINMVSTVTALAILIWALAPISEAHFNPAVTIVALLRREVVYRTGGGCLLAQVLGALAGVALANVMFDLPVFDPATTTRTGAPVWIGEIVATAGLLFVISVLTRTNRSVVAPVVIAAWIGSAYFFTSSTSFANPAVTIGRSLTDTFTGIAPSSVPVFIICQLLGAFLGAWIAALVYPKRKIRESLGRRTQRSNLQEENA